MFKYFNESFFRFLFGFLTILAFSVTLTIVVQNSQAPSTAVEE